MARVDVVLGDIERDVGVVEIRRHDYYAFWLMSRVRSTFLASKILLSNRLADEAMQLTRSLMTDVLRLIKLERSGPDRAAYLLGWANSSITEVENLMREAVTAGLETDPRPLLEKKKAERQQLLGYQERNKVGPLKKFPSEKQLAIEFGLHENYWSFEYASNIVHGQPLTATQRTRSTDDGTVLINTYAADDMWIVVAAYTASEWALFGVRSFRAMYASEPDSRIGALLAEVAAAAEDSPT